MSNMKLEGILAISLAALIMTACIPLILRKVRMNKAYGFRTKLAFKSKKNWYDINAAGGKILCWACLPILALGIYKLFAPERANLFWISIITFCIPGITCICSFRVASKIDKRNESLKSETDNDGKDAERK